VIGRYGALRSAVVLYGVTFTGCGLAFTALSFHIRRKRLGRKSNNDGNLRAQLIRNLTGALVYPAATALAFVEPKISLGIFFGLAAFYYIPRGA
jgi:hypothetical protein